MAAEVPILCLASKEKNVTTIGVATPSSQPQTSGGGKTGKAQKKYLHDKNSMEYKQRRERNNVAVRKSRDKSRLKNLETLNKISELKAENERLVNKVELLSKELSVLKDLFLSNAQELPDPTTTFGLFNSGASSKLETTEPKIIASLGSKLVVANTIEVSVDGNVTQLVDEGDTLQLPVPVADAISSLAHLGHQVVITESSA